MRRFEFKDEKSNKFWEVEVVGEELHLRWGRLGTDGQSKVKEFDSLEAAEKEAAKLVTEKTKKGYVEIKDSELQSRLDQIQNLENDLDAFRSLGDAIKSLATPEDLPAVLTMLKRVSHQDDFGIMHAFGSWIETLSRESKIAGRTVGEHLLKFTTQATNWKILELLVYFSDDLHAARDVLSERIESDDVTDKERGLLEMTLESVEEAIEEEE